MKALSVALCKFFFGYTERYREYTERHRDSYNNIPPEI